jgi:Inner membrane protein YgaP-like, transmembrane domain
MDTSDSKQGNSRQDDHGRRETNVGTQERAASVVSGALVALFGMRRGGFAGALMTLAGGGLIMRGLSGHCPGYAALGMNTAETYGYDAHTYDYGTGRSTGSEAAGGTGQESGHEEAAETRPFDVRTDEGRI